LVNTAYQRAPWFRLVREPLKVGLRIFAWAYRIDPAEYEVRASACYGCLRFYKVALKERSGLFRLLNDRINPLFDALIERIVPQEEIRAARGYAQTAMAGQVDLNELDNFDSEERSTS
jgi:hypothetical protein